MPLYEYMHTDCCFVTDGCWTESGEYLNKKMQQLISNIVIVALVVVQGFV